MPLASLDIYSFCSFLSISRSDFTQMLLLSCLIITGIYYLYQFVDHFCISCKVRTGFLSQDTSLITIFSNVNTVHFLWNFYQNIAFSVCKSMSVIKIRQHAHVLLVSQYSILVVNIHSESIVYLDHQGVNLLTPLIYSIL